MALFDRCELRCLSFKAKLKLKAIPTAPARPQGTAAFGTRDQFAERRGREADARPADERKAAYRDIAFKSGLSATSNNADLKRLLVRPFR